MRLLKFGFTRDIKLKKLLSDTMYLSFIRPPNSFSSILPYKPRSKGIDGAGFNLYFLLLYGENRVYRLRYREKGVRRGETRDIYRRHKPRLQPAVSDPCIYVTVLQSRTPNEILCTHDGVKTRPFWALVTTGTQIMAFNGFYRIFSGHILP